MKEEYIGGIRKETYDLLFKDENIQNSEVIDTTANDEILDTIAFFTKLNNNIFNVNVPPNNIDISKISFDKEKNIYNAEDMQIPFKKLSDEIKDEEIKRELLSNERLHKCHEKTMELVLVPIFSNPTRILTGTCERHGKRYLHSVIEVEGKDKDYYIIDYTLNIIIKKEIYVELTNFIQIEEIKDIELLEDIKNRIHDINAKIKPYLTFRKELRRDLEKNKSMIKQIENQQLDDRIEEIKKQREEGER